MDDTDLGVNSIGVCPAEAASNITRSMRSYLDYLERKQVAEQNRTGEQVAFSEKGMKDTMKRLTSRDSFKMEAILLSQLRWNVLISLTLAASVTYSLPGGFSSENGGAHDAEGPTLRVTYLRCYLALVSIYANDFIASIAPTAIAAIASTCSRLQFLVLFCKALENWYHNIREPLVDYSKLDTPELQHHRDPALSDPQESVPKWLNKLFEVPVDKDEDIKWKTEKEHRHLLGLAFLAVGLTYEAGLSPTGALWQENKADHVVGNLVLSDNHRRCYMAFFYCNATAFVSSVAIILQLVTRKLFARGILTNTLSVCVIHAMIVLTGAFSAVSSRRASTSKYVFILVFAVLVCTALQGLVRVGSGALGDHSVLRHNRGGRSKHLLNFATLDLLLMNADGNCSESADTAVDDEDVVTTTAIKGSSPREATWRVACAAPRHMTGNHSLLLTSSYMPVLDSNDGEVILVNLADNKQAVPLRVQGSGSVRTESMALDDVCYVPGLDSNLVSTGQLARQGCAISLGPGGCRITRGGALVGTARFTEACQFELDFLKVAASSM